MMKKTKPSQFLKHPFDSVEKSLERELTALNIMKILARTGDVFRELTIEEFIAERNKDKHKFNEDERHFFLCMRWWCVSAEEASKFSKAWA